LFGGSTGLQRARFLVTQGNILLTNGSRGNAYFYHGTSNLQAFGVAIKG